MVNKTWVTYSSNNDYTSVESHYQIQNGTVLSTPVAQYLSEKIKENPNLWPREPEWFEHHTRSNPYVCVYDNWKAIGFITVEVYDQNYHSTKIHKIVTFRVDDNYRNKGIWKYLMLRINEKIIDFPAVTYSKNESVGNITMKYLWFKEIERNAFSIQVLEILEKRWPLNGIWYKLYINDLLLSFMEKDIADSFL